VDDPSDSSALVSVVLALVPVELDSSTTPSSAESSTAPLEPVSVVSPSPLAHGPQASAIHGLTHPSFHRHDTRSR
jgi:hypothetical protein